MRVLYVSDNGSDHNRRFLAEISAAGHDVWFFDITSSSAPRGWLPVNVRAVQPRFIVGRKPTEMHSILFELRTILRELRPSLLHAGPVQTAGYLAALSGFHPLLLMSWGSDILVDANQNAEWNEATVFALRTADGFFCDCDTVRKAARSIVPLADNKIVQLPWGLRRSSFSPDGSLPELFEPENDTIRFISTRSWEPLYDVNVLIDAFRLALQEQPQFRLLLLGGGSMAPVVMQQIDRSGLHPFVRVPGQVPRCDLPKWFRAAHCYVSCARSDGTSVSLLEAMATGLPVVVTDHPANREWINEGENGWLARTGNSEDFSTKMLLAAGLTEEERKRISFHNQQVIRDRADWDRNFPRLLSMYEHLKQASVTQ